VGPARERDTARAMSQENVDAVRAIYQRFSEGDFRASVDLLDRQIVFLMMPDAPDAQVYVGVEAVAAATRALFDTWADFTLKAEEFIPAGDSLVVRVRQQGVARISGVPTDEHYFTVWSFRGRKVIRIENFRERAEALEAAGLRE
jgi:ketosteroid isomerase-like protein